MLANHSSQTPTVSPTEASNVNTENDNFNNDFDDISEKDILDAINKAERQRRLSQGKTNILNSTPESIEAVEKSWGISSVFGANNPSAFLPFPPRRKSSSNQNANSSEAATSKATAATTTCITDKKCDSDSDLSSLSELSDMDDSEVVLSPSRRLSAAAAATADDLPPTLEQPSSPTPRPSPSLPQEGAKRLLEDELDASR